jgi:hypothetical protein
VAPGACAAVVLRASDYAATPNGTVVVTALVESSRSFTNGLQRNVLPRIGVAHTRYGANGADEAHMFEPHFDRHVLIYHENPNGVFTPLNLAHLLLVTIDSGRSWPIAATATFIKTCRNAI